MTGVVVVTWNSADVIGNCMNACLSIPGVELIVVDNASADGTADVVRGRRGVRLIANAENRGFAAAVNQGIAALGTDTALLLNPDAVPEGSLEPLEKAVSAAGVGAAGGKLLNEDGTAQDGFNVRAFPGAWTLAFEVLGLNRLFPWNPVNRRYRLQVERAGDVDQPAGAFLMVNRAAWEAVGGLDEGFWPAWFEDVDFCLRLRLAGYRILYEPGSVARHAGGHSAQRLSWPDRQLFWYRSLLRFASLHLSATERRGVCVAVMLACLPRGVLGLFGQEAVQSMSVYSRVFRLAWGCWRDRWDPDGRTPGAIVTEGETGPRSSS